MRVVSAELLEMPRPGGGRRPSGQRFHSSSGMREAKWFQCDRPRRPRAKVGGGNNTVKQRLGTEPVPYLQLREEGGGECGKERDERNGPSQNRGETGARLFSVCNSCIFYLS